MIQKKLFERMIFSGKDFYMFFSFITDYYQQVDNMSDKEEFKFFGSNKDEEQPRSDTKEPSVEPKSEEEFKFVGSLPEEMSGRVTAPAAVPEAGADRRRAPADASRSCGAARAASSARPAPAVHAPRAPIGG